MPNPVTWATAHFASPAWTVFVVVPVLVLASYAAVRRHTHRRLRRFVGAAAPAAPRTRMRHLPVIAFVAALVALTVALAEPERDRRIPHDLAVVMLVIDVSPSMNATDVAPTRLRAAERAATTFTDNLGAGVNLGLVAFSGNADVVVSPTPRHDATTRALDALSTGDHTATGQGIFAALSAIDTLGSVWAQTGSPPPPARIVLLSDGEENVPTNLDAPQGAYTAARLAAQRHVPVSTISIGTPDGHVVVDDHSTPVPVDAASMRQIAALSGGRSYDADDTASLARDYNGITDEIGYQTVRVPDGTRWLRGATVLAILAAAGGLAINRRLPA
ncbi:VWA domain-containing protein [Mycolicibacterium grossiae]|uniref:VWFA domain-containing protein n=1 Tax=Mycolicibacterium grossiae TaxID=1552759 RepID=A0A1E8QB61_9MYCO|nr:VWA domain-containing protein [Mycolicibacterium grossiae]OFJ55521.1 hypothetical protein BEL07_01010 [Mycolicibacterium grossiae]